ncbi:MAG TPA: divalent-cation tolerance protein CutA [Bdellovibrionota bacterium]|nr:divalent-cation tolerance protein CutA [Bdellovibrionota bacterium]
MSGGKFHLVFSATGSRKNARKIAQMLVDRRLAACVNIVPGVQSLFRWKGKRRDERECLILIKTRKSLLPQIERALRKYHAYELPELISLPLGKGSALYLEWIAQSTSKSERK